MPEQDAYLSPSLSQPQASQNDPPVRASWENEERLRLAVAGADIGTWHWDISNGVLEWSPQTKVLFGLSPDDAISYELFLERLHPEDRRPVSQAILRALSERVDYDTEFRVVWPDGSLHWVAARGRAYGESGGRAALLEGIVQNIDARKTAEAKLEAVLEREHRIAETLQRSLLLLPAEDAFAGLTVSTLYEAASEDMEVGGDFLDAFALLENRVALVVGDVSGKGLEAAARTAEVKYVLRAFLREHPAPELALARLNAHLCYSQALEEPDDSGLYAAPSAWELPFEGFVCLVVILVNTVTGELLASSAGAEPPMVLRANGQVDEIAVYGTPLAVTPNTDYASFQTHLAEGDLLVMMTDGITEARRRGDFFGPEGLAQAVAQAGTASPLWQIAQNVFEQARKFTGAKLRDDACLLLARRR